VNLAEILRDAIRLRPGARVKIDMLDDPDLAIYRMILRVHAFHVDVKVDGVLGICRYPLKYVQLLSLKEGW
jgi:hypothetical protein